MSDQDIEMSELNDKLKEIGLSVSRRDKAYLLGLHPSTRAKKLSELRKALLNTPDLASNPFEVLSMIDGRCSTKTYAVAAIAGTNRAIAIRKFSRNSFKVKFYPDYTSWGFEHADVPEMFGGTDSDQRSDYWRFMATLEGLHKVLDYAASQPGVAFADIVAVRAKLDDEEMPEGAVTVPAQEGTITVGRITAKKIGSKIDGGKVVASGRHKKSEDAA